MNTAALEMNDTAFVVVSGGQRLVASPGYALLGREPPIVGEAAQRMARLEPIATHTRFWLDLDAQPLPGQMAGGRSRADLAWLHLKHVLEQLPQKPDGLTCAVPASMRAPQLSLLLGIVSECGVPLRGLIDSAVAAASAWQGTGRFIHVDLHLNHALMSAVDVADDVRLARSEIRRGAGLVALHETWARLVARRFVAQTRFDPMHRAADEQALFDALPGWLEQLGRHSSIDVEIAFGADKYKVALTQEEFRIEAAPLYSRIVMGVRKLRRAGEPLVIGLSEHAARLPGLVERLADMTDTTLLVFPAAAPAFAALAHEKSFSAGVDTATLLRAVPVLSGAAVAGIEPRELAVAQPAKKAVAPTHVLYRGQAHALSEQPLVVGLGDAPPAPLNWLPIAGTAAGISHLHCSLLRTGETAEVVDSSQHGTWLNDERVSGRSRLYAGDRVRVGTPGATLELIAL